MAKRRFYLCFSYVFILTVLQQTVTINIYLSKESYHFTLSAFIGNQNVCRATIQLYDTTKLVDAATLE